MNPILINIHDWESHSGIKINNQTANKVAKIAEGQVIMYHNLRDIILSCFSNISLAGELFLEASI
jgi:hypothetical protein